MTRRLHNYLRTYRKRAGLSQDEVAFLLGAECGTKVSRYERRSRTPGLNAVFAYEVIFGVAPRSFLPGAFNKVEHETLKRARILIRKLSKAPTEPLTERKLELLRTITSGSGSEPAPKL